jgi:hypothetical protein
MWTSVSPRLQRRVRLEPHAFSFRRTTPGRSRPDIRPCPFPLGEIFLDGFVLQALDTHEPLHGVPPRAVPYQRSSGARRVGYISGSMAVSSG